MPEIKLTEKPNESNSAGLSANELSWVLGFDEGKRQQLKWDEHEANQQLQEILRQIKANLKTRLAPDDDADSSCPALVYGWYIPDEVLEAFWQKWIGE